MQRYIMVIDQGTTSTRVVLCNHAGEIVEMSQRACVCQYPQNGWVEQDAQVIWEDCVECIRDVMHMAQVVDTQIAAIGITNQRETTIVWEKSSGMPVYPAIVWQSRQSNAYCETVKEAGYEDCIRSKTGLLVDPYFSASKIRFILDHIPYGNQRSQNEELLFGTMDTWLLYKLTNGKCHMSDVSNASRTMLMNIHTMEWDPALLAIWDIPACMLPEIRDTSEVYGYTASLFSHPIAIASLVGDQQAALFGQTCFSPGDVKNTYGTGCFLLMHTGERVIDSNHGLLSSVGWRIGTECVYVLEGSVFMAGAAIQWLRDDVEMIASSAESEIQAELVEDNGGVYVVPAFTGLGAPYWKPNVKGAIFGLTRNSKKAHIVRAVLESLAYQTYDVVKAMEKDSGYTITHMQVDGKASLNNFLMQFQSDILQCEIIRGSISETTALGAATLAGLAVNFWKDKAEICRNYKTAQTFQARIDEEKRNIYLQEWMKAVTSTMLF